jgi:hypothetical protein
MDGSYTVLLDNGGRPGVFGLVGSLSFGPMALVQGWANKTSLMTLEDLEIEQANRTMGANGRGTIDVMFYGRTYNQYYNYSFAAYMVSPTRMYWVETDNQTVFAGLLEGNGSGQLDGRYTYMGGAITTASGSEGAVLALLDATPPTSGSGTFDGIVDANLPTNVTPSITRVLGSTQGNGTFASDTNSIRVKWVAWLTGLSPQYLTFYVNSSDQAVMVGQTAISDNPVIDGWLTMQ